MATTSHLGLTLVEQAQAQKEVTVNEALSRIDAILNTGVQDKDLATPPGSPMAGDVYIVAASPTGAWTGKADNIAYYDQVWRFIEPKEGATFWVCNENVSYTYNGAAWVLTQPASGDVEFTDLGSKSGNFNVVKSDGAYQRFQLTANISNITLPALPASGEGFRLLLEIVQDGTGSRTVTTWSVPSSSVLWKGADKTLSTPGGSIDIVEFCYSANGVRAVLHKNFG